MGGHRSQRRGRPRPLGTPVDQRRILEDAVASAAAPERHTLTCRRITNETERHADVRSHDHVTFIIPSHSLRVLHGETRRLPWHESGVVRHFRAKEGLGDKGVARGFEGALDLGNVLGVTRLKHEIDLCLAHANARTFAAMIHAKHVHAKLCEQRQ